MSRLRTRDRLAGGVASLVVIASLTSACGASHNSAPRPSGNSSSTDVAAPATPAHVVGSASSAGGSPSVLGNAPATDSSGAATSVRPDYWVIAVAGFNHPIGIHITTEQLAADAATVRQRMKALGDPYPAVSVNGNDLIIAAAARLLPTQDAYAIGQQGNWALRALLYAGGPTSKLPLPTARLVGADVAAHFDALDCSIPGEAVNQIADAANNQTAVTQIECGGSGETSKYLLGSVLLTGGASATTASGRTVQLRPDPPAQAEQFVEQYQGQQLAFTTDGVMRQLVGPTAPASDGAIDLTTSDVHNATLLADVLATGPLKLSYQVFRATATPPPLIGVAASSS